MNISGILIAVVILAVIGMVLWGLTRPKSGNFDQELNSIVTGAVGSKGQIKNCALYVRRGDGSFSWSGAAGLAEPDRQVSMTADTPVYIASITKLYTAAAIMKLYEQGALALQDPMSKYLPPDLIRGIQVYGGHDYSNEITIAQLLSHTSGIPDYYSDKAKDGSTMFEIFMADPGRPWTVDQMIARARDDMTPQFPPGAKASYSDTNFQLLGRIIEAVTGKPLQVVFNEFFFQPLGLKHTWLVGLSSPQATPSAAVAHVYANDTDITSIRSNGAYWAEGGIVSTLEDQVTFLQALNEGKIIRPDTLQLMHSNWRQLQGLPFTYGYGTMKLEIPPVINRVTQVPPVWGHTGSVGSFLYYAPGPDLYLAGTIDQTADRVTPVLLMIKILKAYQKFAMK
ncbi:MAG TPA: serine hydrolase domain-containing protein [Anaerolineales bacterium]|nr:serine hydrolase domain-containing protein [Anaerolineales bacterium]